MEFKIKEARMSAGISQKDLADRLGISASTLSGYETGAHDPKSDILSAIAGICDVTVDFLLGRTPDRHGKAGARQPRDVVPLSSALPDDAMQMARRYSGLDRHGKTVVNVVVAEEEKRMTEEQKQRRAKKFDGREVAGESAPRVIPLYLTPPAAGYASPVFGEDFEYIEVGGEVPVHADYAVKIDGDSMEPYIMDGATVYVNRDPLANGDVGIFYCDGDMLCKQYYKDRWGSVWLLSLNRDRADADRFIEADSGLTLVCHGRVILPFPLSLAVPESELH